MKKFLSLLLVLVMLITVPSVAFAESKIPCNTGDIIQFGTYPQTEVTDKALITELSALAPDWDDWTSYGYYSGDGSVGSMKQGDWMRYTDVTYNADKYRGIKFITYRPDYTNGLSSNTCQDDNGYSIDTVYWFKFEPVNWRVLNSNTGLIMCETIIDSQPYNNTVYYKRNASDSKYSYFSDTSYTNYACDYESSFIRQWLNNDFYNAAFTASEKSDIITTVLNNDGYYTSTGTSGYEKLDSSSTEDNVFLLSYNEVRNTSFGFNSKYSSRDTARQAKGSDYAKSQGLYVYTDSNYNGNSNWLLRTSGNISDSCCGVNYCGYLIRCSVTGVNNGVRPALRINRISAMEKPEHTHTYQKQLLPPVKIKVTQPTPVNAAKAIKTVIPLPKDIITKKKTVQSAVKNAHTFATQIRLSLENSALFHQAL